MAAEEEEVELYKDQEEETLAGESAEINQEEDGDDEPEKEIKLKRKFLRTKITRAINRLADSMKKHEHDKKRYKIELKTISRNFDRVLDINSELYEIIPFQKNKLDKWEAEVSNQYYRVVEKVEEYSRDSVHEVKTRSKTKKSLIETSSDSSDDSTGDERGDKGKHGAKDNIEKQSGDTAKEKSVLDAKTLHEPGIVDDWIDDLVEFERTKFDVSSDSMSLADVIYRLEASRDIPAFKLSTFNGDPFTYVDFIESFKIHIHDKRSLTDDQRMIQLKAHLAGDARCAVDALGASGVMYATALKLLKRQFGQRSIIARAFINRLCKGEKLKPNDRKSLRTLSVDIVGCLATLKRIHYMSDVNSIESLRAIVGRLPNNLIGPWRSVAADIRDAGRNPTLQDISNYIQRRVRADYDPDFGDVVQTSPTSTDKREKARDRKDGVYSAQRAATCYFCKNNHRINDCVEFKGVPVSEKIRFVKGNRLCFACLVKGHEARNCRSKQQCDVDGCVRTHHTLLHVESFTASGAMPDVASDCDAPSIMPVIRAKFRSPNGRIREGNVFIDSGAGTSLIRREFAKSLGLQGKRGSFEISVVGERTVRQSDSRNVRFFLSGTSGSEEFEIEAHELDRTILNVPELDRKWLSEFRHLRDLDFSHKGGPVDLILGVRYSHLHAEQEVREGRPFEPIAKRTRLGWIVLGSGRGTRSGLHSINHFRLVEDVDIQRMYDLETLGVQAPDCSCPVKMLTEEDKKVLSCFEETCENVGGRYVIGLPWRKDPRHLPNNRPLAERRLVSLEKSLSRDQEKAECYCRVMDDYLTRGWAEEIDSDEEKPKSGLEYYLPHFAVYRPDKVSTPLRIVFDPACEYRGVSLNSFLLKGPNLIGDLMGVLIRFRENPVAFAGDISKMFLQICLMKRDTDVHRFLWRRLDMHREPTTYRLLRVTFGDRASPDAASFVMFRIAQDNREEYPAAAEILERDRYVDDILHSCNSEEDADVKMRDLETILKTGSFEIKEWLISHRVKKSEDIDVSLCDDQSVKTLGVVWNCASDTIHFRVQSFSAEVYTKRSVLSYISTIYDPLGLAGAVTIRARIGMQAIWRMKTCDWDDELPEDVCQQWERLFQDLERLSEVHTNRSVKPTDATGDPELHLFADASSQAYGACAYIRWPTSDDSAEVRLMASKSRVAPLKQSTIPRLELMAALLASRLARTIYNELMMKPQVYLWMDSQIVLHWLKTESSRRKAFVGVRVSEIQMEWNPEQWYYVPTKENPADDLSRGLRVQDVGKRWFQGPDFLTQPREQWPKQERTENSEYTVEDKVLKACFTFSMSLSVPFMDNKRYSSWSRLARVTAYCLRFIDNLKKRLSGRDSQDGCLLPEEIRAAETYWIKEAQRDLGNWTKTCAELSPFVKDDVVHVGGRLRKSSLSYEEVHPILLPNGVIARLILAEAHENVYHGGVERTLSQSRLRFWIIRGRNATKKLVRNCFICRKLRQQAHTTLMADLPPERVNVYSPPFTTTGIDLFGPFYLKYGRNKRIKSWGAVFTCATIRAIHLEIVESLSTESFLFALRRFAAHHGWPRTIISDNGSSFIGAERELRKIIPEAKQEIEDFSVRQKLKWIFTTPLSPHQGGIYESLVKQAKRALKTTVGEQVLSWNEMSTVFLEIESLLNSRPLGYSSDSPEDLRPLTPNHFMIGRASCDAPQGPLEESACLRRRWEYTQSIVQSFWRRFIREYLPSLMRKMKWKTKGRQLQIGDVVLIVDYNLPRGKWTMARVIETYPGDDGIVRNVKVKTPTGEFKRSIQKCCVLLESDSTE